MCRWKKKKSRPSWRKAHRITAFCEKTTQQCEKNTESAECIYMCQFLKWSELLQECMKFNTTKCKGTGWLPYSSLPVRRGWATGWPVLCSKKENLHQSNISLFYWNTHIRDKSLERFNKGWTSKELDTKGLQCWTLWKQNLILTSLVTFCFLYFPSLPFS